MPQKVHLIIIDPQVDFCSPQGKLYVKGAEQDIPRLANMIRRLKNKIDDIHVTLDSHHLLHVAHPIWWRDSHGKMPDPFTIITASDVESGRWTTRQPSFYRRSLNYVKQLEQNGRYPLCIWPPHCLIGSDGHKVVPQLFDALTEWENDFAVVDYVTKGSNIFTEHYSAIQADVPDPSDPGTQVNTAFIQTLMDADIVLVAGEAGSHCLANTVTDLGNNFKDDSMFKKMVLLKDATCPVPGFEKMQDDFVKMFVQRGGQVTTTVDYLA